jgi:hypothetical protein
MKASKNKTKISAYISFGLFVLVGTYNAIVINSESFVQEASFVKRLDEHTGVTRPGRQVANTVVWQKLVAPKMVEAKKVESVSPTAAALEEAIPSTAAVQEELSLNLTEVINTKKYKNGLTNAQFTGALQTNNGIIESLSVSLPNGEGVSVSFSEMAGNVFEYDINGNLYSGMMYQVDSGSYMVTLTNGPLEGTRMKFASEAQVEQTQPDMPSAEVAGVETATFGAENQVAENEMNLDGLSESDKVVPQEVIGAQAFNMSSI